MATSAAEPPRRERNVVRRPVTFCKKPSTSDHLNPNKNGKGTVHSQLSKSRQQPQERPFLTSSQLSDLFTRLDKNSDGELDLYEFTGIIRALRLPVSEDAVAEIFRNVDTSASGTLDLQEFICAYQKLHASLSGNNGKDNQNGSTAAGTQQQQRDEKAEFVRATRYGTDEYGDPVFTLYTIEYRNGKAQGYKYNFISTIDDQATNNAKQSPSHSSSIRQGGARRSIISTSDRGAGIESYFRHAQKEVYSDGLEGIMKMMRRDSKLNVEYFDASQCRLLWWMDVALHRVERATISRYVDLFGLPNHSKFLSNFGNFGNIMSKDEKSHVFVGDGVTVHGAVHSMSMFVQTALLVDRPILHLFPSGVDGVGSKKSSCCLVKSEKSNTNIGAINENNENLFVLLWNLWSIIVQRIRTMFYDYYRSRIAFLINFASLSDTNEKEKMASYEMAASIAARLRDDTQEIGTMAGSDDESSDSEHEEFEEDEVEKKPSQYATVAVKKTNQVKPTRVVVVSSTNNNNTEGSDNDEFNFGIIPSKGKELPLPRVKKYRTPPNWVASASHLQKKPPSIKFETMGLHILDHGPGANTLLTIRCLENQEKLKDSKAKTVARLRAKLGQKVKTNTTANWTTEERSRSGVLGRILDGVWLKLLENIALDGVTDIAGELDDSPVTLTCFLTMLIHSFSMANLSALDDWINMVEADVKDIVVSKHTFHIKEMNRIVKEFAAYVEPTTHLFNTFYQQWESESHKKSLAVAATSSYSNMSSRRTSHVGALPDFANRKQSSVPVKPSSIFDRRSSRRPSILVSHMNSQPTNFRRMSIIGDVDKIPLSYAVLERFFGDHAYRDLKMILDGYETLDLKGLLHWQERLNKLEQKIQEVNAFIDSQMEEKRNFTTFSLTILTTVLAPMAILTGYFGMNFQNMYELDPHTYPWVPGVRLFWAVAVSFYFLLLMFAFHFRIIYSAT